MREHPLNSFDYGSCVDSKAGSTACPNFSSFDVPMWRCDTISAQGSNVNRAAPVRFPIHSRRCFPVRLAPPARLPEYQSEPTPLAGGLARSGRRSFSSREQGVTNP